jgi:hypothetical protein
MLLMSQNRRNKYRKDKTIFGLKDKDENTK